MTHPADISTMTDSPQPPLVLLVLDGVGVGLEDPYDAVAKADTPTLDGLKAAGLYRTLRAHGTAVGLPSDADMGNSEVGHNIMGAGRIFAQGARRIEEAVAAQEIWSGTWEAVVDQARQPNSTLHLIGLLSDGNVHSNIAHLDLLIERAVNDGVQRVRVHTLLDGRDVPDGSAESFVTQLEESLAAVQAAHPGTDCRIASGGGRMVTTMDRYGANWDVVRAGWEAHVLGKAPSFPSASDAIRTARAADPDISDQYLPAFTVTDGNGDPVGQVVDGDAVVIFNFRGDRVLQLSMAFEYDSDSFTFFDRERVPEIVFAGMALYDGDTNLPTRYLVNPQTVPNTLSEVLVSHGVSQYACAETQKFGHVTYFWNGNRSGMFDPALETYEEFPSDVVTFDQRPWMKSAETADAIIAALDAGKARFLRANFAGGDMVGHTGDMRSTVIAVEAIDLAISRIAPAVARHGGILLVTADHGNAEEMVLRDGCHPRVDGDGNAIPRTAHSLNPVPIWLVDYGADHTLRTDLPDAGLANVASTVMQLLNLEPHPDYEPGLLSS